MTRLPEPEAFLSGERGEVARGSERLLRRAGDRLLDAGLALRRVGQRLDALAERTPAREVLVAAVYRPGSQRLSYALGSLASARHRVRLAFGSTGPEVAELAPHTVTTELREGKFPNLNRVIAQDGQDFDWLVAVDDDVALPERFIDRVVAICEHFDLTLAQPAQTLASHAAWPNARRRAGSLVRETRFVEIGPVTAFRRDAADSLLPFPELRYGWGLDLAWAATAQAAGWRLGIVDALPVRHEHEPVARGYSSDEAIEEARRFLAERPFLTSAAASETIAVHRRLGV